MIETDILLRPAELVAMAIGANPVGASLAKEEEEVHIDENGIHKR